jgi:hypothetical protein
VLLRPSGLFPADTFHERQILLEEIKVYQRRRLIEYFVGM